MPNKERKLIKVIMEYDNGDIEYIEGNDVTKWQDTLNSTIVLDYIHGRQSQNILKDIIWRKMT